MAPCVPGPEITRAPSSGPGFRLSRRPGGVAQEDENRICRSEGAPTTGSRPAASALMTAPGPIRPALERYARPYLARQGEGGMRLGLAKRSTPRLRAIAGRAEEQTLSPWFGPAWRLEWEKAGPATAGPCTIDFRTSDRWLARFFRASRSKRWSAHASSRDQEIYRLFLRGIENPAMRDGHISEHRLWPKRARPHRRLHARRKGGHFHRLKEAGGARAGRAGVLARPPSRAAACQQFNQPVLAPGSTRLFHY